MHESNQGVTKLVSLVKVTENLPSVSRHLILLNLILVLLNKLRCHALFKFTANQIVDINSHTGTEWQTVQIQISWLLRSQLIWIYTICKGRVYPCSAGQGSSIKNDNFRYFFYFLPERTEFLRFIQIIFISYDLL